MDERDLPLSDHLEELRKRLLGCLIPAGILLVPAVWGSQFLLLWLMEPLSDLGLTLYLYHITDGLMLRLRLGLLLDFLIIAPLFAFELGQFLRPGLLPAERKTVCLVSLSVGGAFTLGAIGFLLWLAPMATRLWYERESTESLLSASGCTTLWLISALLCGILAALFPLVGAVLVHLRHRKENHTP